MSTIFTIGYEGTDIERFVETLKEAGVAVIADVRAVAVSRKRGFSKNGLIDRLAKEDIRYIHLRDLGDPKPGREAARAGRYEAFRIIYEEHLATDQAQDDLAILEDLMVDGATCLMCFERDPRICHRSIIAKALPLNNLIVHDLYADRSGPTDHAARRAGYHYCQGVAASE